MITIPIVLTVIAVLMVNVLIRTRSVAAAVIVSRMSSVVTVSALRVKRPVKPIPTASQAKFAEREPVLTV